MEITNKQQAAAGYTEVDPQAYEAVLNGKPVHLYTLTNKQGLIVKISNFGARLVQVLVPQQARLVQARWLEASPLAVSPSVRPPLS